MLCTIHIRHSRSPDVKAVLVAGWQPLGVSTLAENAVPQRPGDVGGQCAANGFPDRYVPARAALSVCIYHSWRLGLARVSWHCDRCACAKQSYRHGTSTPGQVIHAIGPASPASTSRAQGLDGEMQAVGQLKRSQDTATSCFTKLVPAADRQQHDCTLSGLPVAFKAADGMSSGCMPCT